MKRRWFVVSLLVGVLALGVVGGTALAQEEGTASDSPLGKFASRVAAILGLDEAQVQDAFNQAAGEIQDEALQRKLDCMVEQGRLTQEQADDYTEEGYMSQPEGSFPGLQFREMRGDRLHRGGMMGGRGGHGMGFWGQMPPAPTPTPESSGATGL
ncbi:MAG: hypothetical protein ABID84_02880 [Chloroflexota bacterium]